MVQEFKEVLKDPAVWNNVKDELLDTAIRTYLSQQATATRRKTVNSSFDQINSSETAQTEHIVEAVNRGHSREEFKKSVGRLTRDRVDFPVPFFHKRIQECTGVELIQAANRARKTAETYVDTANKLELIYEQLDDEQTTVGEQLTDTQLHMILHKPKEAA